MQQQQEYADGVLLVFYKTNLSRRVRRVLNLGDPVETVNSGQPVYVQKFRHAFGADDQQPRTLAVSNGITQYLPVESARIAQRISAVLPTLRPYLVCLASERARLEPHMPNTFRYCITVEEIERAVGVQLSDEQQLQLRRFMPYNPGGDQRFRMPPGFIMGLGSFFRMLDVGQMEQPLPAEAQALHRAMQASMEEQGPQGNIREQERGKHPWDALLGTPLKVASEGEDACVSCMENAPSIRFVDAAGACDHVTLCDDCARIIMDTTRKCPLCRAQAVTIRRAEPHREEGAAAPEKKKRKKKVHKV